MAFVAERRRIRGLTMLLAAVVLAAVGAGVIAGGVLLADSRHVPERTASALVLSVTNCGRTNCSYRVSYLSAQGTMQASSIWAAIGEANAGGTATIYYQVAHPDVARFPDSDYPNDVGDPLAGFGVILFLCALVLALAGVARLTGDLIRARRARDTARAPGGVGSWRS